MYQGLEEYLILLAWSESPPFCPSQMKKAKRRLMVDPIDFEREYDYVEPGQRSNQVKLAPLAVMI